VSNVFVEVWKSVNICSGYENVGKHFVHSIESMLSMLFSLYKSVVRPHLEYCTSSWSPHCDKDKELLEKVQHRFIKILPDLRKLPYLQRLKEPKLWTLEKKRTRTNLIEIYKIIKGLATVSFDIFWNLVQILQQRANRWNLRREKLQLTDVFISSQNKLSISETVSIRKQLEPVHWISSRGIQKHQEKHQRWVFLLAADAA